MPMPKRAKGALQINLLVAQDNRDSQGFYQASVYTADSANLVMSKRRP